MKIRNLITTVFFLVLMCTTSLLFARDVNSRQNASPEMVGAQKVVPGMVVIKFRTGLGMRAMANKTGIESVDRLLQQTGIVRLEPVIGFDVSYKKTSKTGLNRIYYAHFNGHILPQKICALLKTDPNIEYVEPLYLHSLCATPNDSLFSRQGFYEIIQAPAAWDVARGEQGDVIIAIVDGGTDIRHPDLAANLWVNPGEIPDNGVDDDGNKLVDDIHGWNFADSTNDPSGLDTQPFNANHGTHTAGIACAVTNNRIGVAGASWNARLMVINAASARGDSSIAFGFNGILYAASKGADIISCSWGRLGAPSSFEQDVINYAAEQGAVVVAAAGNDNKSALHYPSSYANVLSVAATNNEDSKAYFSNYGRVVDISAPGVSILSTVNHGKYATYQGTSMACPLAAGIVALVKTKHPDWTGMQAAEQVRVTSDNIDQINPSYAGQLGHGRLNAFRAATETSPAIRIASVDFVDQNNDGVIQRGEQVSVTLTLKNYLAPANNIQLTLSENDEFAEITSGVSNISSLATLEEKTISTPFVVTIAHNAPSGHPVIFDVEIASGDYQDRDYFTLTVLPFFGTLDINNVAMSVTNIGRIGFFDSNDPTSGIGFKYKGGPNLLFEGSMIAGTSAKQISNSARGLIVDGSQQSDEDFEITEDGDLQIMTPGSISDQESIGIFTDSKADNPMHIRIIQETSATRKPPFDDFVLFRFTIENNGTEMLDNFHFGLFLDWDMDGQHYSTNKVGYDPERRLGYAYDTDGGPGTYVGVSLLTDGGISYRAIYNDYRDPNNPSWALHDGFTDEEKWESISAGIQYNEAGPADISQVMGTGPFRIEPNTSIQIGFALLAGEDLPDLQVNTDSARVLWQRLFATGVAQHEQVAHPARFGLWQNYPNPFNPTTTIRYDLVATSNVELAIYNTLGQRIRTLVRKQQMAGSHSVQWNGKDSAGNDVPAGTYLCRLQAGDEVRIIKMVLLK